VQAEVMLAAMVLVDPPACFASAIPDDSNGDDGWLVISAAQKQYLASGDITGSCNVLLFSFPPLSLFGGPGHPLVEPWPPLATILD
jgi:hypothetical protein